VANRGEIACRVFRTCKEMGIKTVAIYSEADANAMHTKMADEAICIGPAASSDSYLRIDRILNAIEQTGADAVHPGYGFLSENAEFSKALKEKGVTFIGPGPFAINAMGDKIHSKKIAQDAGVNTIPGFVGALENEAEVLKVAQEIGYPVMIKASAGGGGKGMRIAWNDKEAVQGYNLSRREAAASFGDDTIFVEKFVESPRHIEIQILMDSKQNGVYLNERECSVQRRNQKVVEEAPSVFVDEKTRKAMGEQALALAKAVQYQSAGTVEFLMDKHKNFYFLEMNTRLQVEHPITEKITGVDIVEEMLHIAAEKPLRLSQDDIGINGWAVESRVYAEDPYREFLPSIGLLTTYKEPVGESVRVDTGVSEGSEISMFYDPMISKLVTHANTRDEALDRMCEALDKYTVQGVRHNIPLLRAVCSHPAFRAGEITTNFIPEHFPEGFIGIDMKSQDWGDLAMSLINIHQEVTGDKSGCVIMFENGLSVEYGEEKQLSYLQIPEELDSISTQLSEGKTSKITSSFKKGDSMFIGEKSSNDALVLQVLQADSPNYRVVYHGEEFSCRIIPSHVYEYEKYMPKVEAIDTSKMLVSPMPGMVFSINVKEGQSVEAGEEVCIVEAMKMQNALQAPATGVISKVHVNAGQSVDADQLLLELE